MASPETKKPNYIPASRDELFSSLCKVHRIFDLIGVQSVITGGTLLGAVRNGDLLPNDSDWDVEVIDSDVETILGHRDLFEADGLILKFPITCRMLTFPDRKPSANEVERRIIEVYDTQGVFHGDIFIHTLFSDGILRRFNLSENAYFNAKMTFPYWFIENRRKIQIRNRLFFCPAEPELMVARIYGPRWKTPFIKHGPKIKGYNYAGAYLNAPIEPGLCHALSVGWVPYYPDRPTWPRAIALIDNNTTHSWIRRHEHLDLENRYNLSFPPEQLNARLVAQLRIQVTELKRLVEEHAVREKRTFRSKVKASIQSWSALFISRCRRFLP